MTTTGNRPARALTALALAAVVAGCASTPISRARVADELRQYDVAVAEYTKAVRLRPADREAQFGLDRARLRASDAHLLKGRRQFSLGRYDEALVELQLATELNPTNNEAERDLRAVRSALRAQLSTPADGKTALESILARGRDLVPAGLELPDAKLPTGLTTGSTTLTRDLYRTVAQLLKLSVTFDSGFRDGPAPVTLQAGMPIKQVLDVIARSTGTFYQVTAPSVIVVVNDTTTKRREYTQEVMRQFVIQNADLKEVSDVLRVVGDVRNIQPITGTNTLVVRDSPERLQIIAKFIAAFDKARPEVSVQVEVLEVNRTQLQEYGLQIANSGAVGIDGSIDANREGLSVQSLRSLGQSNFLLSIPALYYRLLKTDANTRTLANPHIRMTDGMPSSANFGEDVPVPRTTFAPIAQGGLNQQPTTSFEYRKIGVNLGITPRTHPNDEVTLALNIELSSLAGTGFDGLPTFGSRSVQTTITLKDGETNILAGLIRDDERRERQSIPGFGKVPILGNMLFAKNHREATQTDVVIMLTPHIIRVLDVSEEDLRPLLMPREAAGGAQIEIGPVVPPPPIIRDNTPAAAESTTPSLPVSAGMPTGVLPVTPVTAPGKIIKR